jgi:hypothetical protein
VIVLPALIFFTPFPAMIFSGMEHLLQVLLNLLFVWLFSELIIQKNETEGSSVLFILALLACGLSIVRYESYALFVVACFLLMIRRRWKLALIISMAFVLPQIVIQGVSVAHGGFWLPNTIIIRSGALDLATVSGSRPVSPLPSVVLRTLRYLSDGVQNALDGLPVTALVAISALLLIASLMKTKSIWTRTNVGLTVFVSVAIAHLIFGKIGQFFRYEAYLVALGIFVNAQAAGDVFLQTPGQNTVFRGRKTATYGLICLIGASLIPLIVRGLTSCLTLPTASRNIFEQQYQMGSFLRTYYPTESVAVNDIGAVTYLTDVHLLDLAGLASNEVLLLKKERAYTTERIQQLCAEHGVRIAIIYDPWLQRGETQGVPSGWTKLCEWKIFDNIVCSSDVVSFYATNRSDANDLATHLHQYRALLPPRVTSRDFWNGVK